MLGPFLLCVAITAFFGWTYAGAIRGRGWRAMLDSPLTAGNIVLLPFAIIFGCVSLGILIAGIVDWIR